MRVLIIERESTVVHEINDQAVEGYGEWKYRCTRFNNDTTSSYVISCTPTHIHWTEGWVGPPAEWGCFGEETIKPLVFGLPTRSSINIYCAEHASLFVQFTEYCLWAKMNFRTFELAALRKWIQPTSCIKIQRRYFKVHMKFYISTMVSIFLQQTVIQINPQSTCLQLDHLTSYETVP
jgi:hypothetical protein